MSVFQTEGSDATSEWISKIWMVNEKLYNEMFSKTKENLFFKSDFDKTIFSLGDTKTTSDHKFIIRFFA